MAKKRRGYVFREGGRWYARFTYTDGSGKRRNVKWRVVGASNKTEAEDELAHVLRSYESRGTRALDGNRLLFRELARLYEEHKLIPPQYVGDRKVAGLRSWRTPRGFLRTLVEHFGAMRIKEIVHSDVLSFKLLRFGTPTVRDAQRTIASVNRELELLRSILRYAKREGWLEKSPFETGDVLISKADETERMRILTRQEESALLAACTRRREHLRPLLIAALDTAMRRGELLKLRWADVDLVNRRITIRSMNTKTARARKVGITPRLAHELEALYERSPKDSPGLVFGIKDTVKRSFASACRDANIEGFRFHDCRHTAITRMLRAGMEASEVMKISGHTQWKTFLRYVNPDDEAVKEYAEQLAAYNSRNELSDVTELLH